MQRVLLAFLLLVSVSMSAQNSAVSTLPLPLPPANDPPHASKIAGVTANVHNISLCQTYDHYLHDIPVSMNSDSYMREILVEQKSASVQSNQEKTALSKKIAISMALRP